MARIRTVKPEFWTDSVMVQLPFEARLLFIGLWNFCDDQGFLVNEPERLRMQVFPSEPSIDLASLLDLLVSAERLEMFTAPDGESLLRIKNFEKHQRVDNPSKPRFAGAKKRAIPNSVRRAVAVKYGCSPGGEKTVACFYCGTEGHITWWPLSSGKPSFWVSFSLELDHVEAEAAGGDGEAKNIVLACRACNRSKGVKEFAEMWPSLASPREPSPPEGKGREKERKGKGKEEEAQGSAPQTPSAVVWDSYAKAYQVRYGTEPVRNGKVNGQLAQLVKRLPVAEAPEVAAYYLGHNASKYVGSGHSVGLLLIDCEKLRTEWATGRQVTHTAARHQDQTQENLDGWKRVGEELKRGLV